VRKVNQLKFTTSPHHHIITSAHHHITTSPHHHITTSSHQHITTSPHHHITTSSHHHITTSPHHHIITSPHQHITTSSHHHITTSAHPQINRGVAPMALLFVVDVSFYHIVTPIVLILRPAPCAPHPALTFRGPADARKSEVRKVNQLKFTTSPHPHTSTSPNQRCRAYGAFVCG
jgi:hypothetical protein